MLCRSLAVAEALGGTEHAIQLLQFRIPLLASFFSKMAYHVAFLQKFYSGKENKNKIDHGLKFRQLLFFHIIDFVTKIGMQRFLHR